MKISHDKVKFIQPGGRHNAPRSCHREANSWLRWRQRLVRLWPQWPLAAALVLIIAAMFAYQQWQLTRLRARWNQMSDKVKELTEVQNQVVQFQPWFDTSFHYLTLLKDLTVAFPQQGTVTAKTVEIRDKNTVSCAGTAQSYAALLATTHQVGLIEGVSDFLPQTRGKSPIQFSFEFKLNAPPSANEN